MEFSSSAIDRISALRGQSTIVRFVISCGNAKSPAMGLERPAAVDDYPVLE